MVDESGVEAVAKRPEYYQSSSVPLGEFRGFYGVAYVEHPEFGMVAMRFETINRYYSQRPIKEWEANWDTFISGCFEGAKAAAAQECEA